jgi:hypothetical protein
LPFVLYGCKTWSLTLRKKHRLRVFEDKVLRRIFGPKGNELHEGGESCIMRFILYYIIFRMIKSRRLRYAEHVAQIEEECIQVNGWKAGSDID